MLSTMARRSIAITVTFLVSFVLVSGLARTGVVDVVRGDLVVQHDQATASTRLDRLMTRHACSTTGLGDGVIPAHSIVRDEPGRAVRLTSFDEGWEMYAGDRSGTLVAVCAR
jgi:hypothetical protein